MPTATLYTMPGCPECTMTKAVLEKTRQETPGFDYSVIDLSQDAEALETVKAMGYLSVPVVVTDADHWSRHRPDKLVMLRAQLAG